MSKKSALIIGVGKYKEGLSTLPGALKDVEALHQVLTEKEIGGFEVERLENPTLREMRIAVTNFFKECGKDDLALLYFSGHGVTNDHGSLLLTTCETSKDNFEATSVASRFIRDAMDKSYCRRQVIILDCCYSGAFTGWTSRSVEIQFDELLCQQEDTNIDVDDSHEFGSEGRVVLTSSSSTQLSFEYKDRGLYTRYLIEGIRTGAADQGATNRKDLIDGKISAQELHEYAKKRVKAVKPAMDPTFSSYLGGYDIVLTHAPLDSPILNYRRLVEGQLKAKDGEISDVLRTTFDVHAKNLGLSGEDVKRIEGEVLAPYIKRKKSIDKYEEAFEKAANKNFPIKQEGYEDLKFLQRILGLRDKDVAPIETRVNRMMERLAREEADNLVRPGCLRGPLRYLIISLACLVTLAAVSILLKIILPLLDVEKNTANVATFEDVPDVPNGIFDYGGSTTWAPIRGKIEPKMLQAHPQFRFRFDSEANGSTRGIEFLIENEIAFSQSSRKLEGAEKDNDLKEVPVAIEGIAIAVHPELDVPSLTLADLRSIYTGEVVNWQDLGGPDLAITPLSRNLQDSGTVHFFAEFIMGFQDLDVEQLGNSIFGENVQFFDDPTPAFREVAKIPGSIFYASAPEVVEQCSIRPIPLIHDSSSSTVTPYVPPLVEGPQCMNNRNRVNTEAMRSGRYPITRRLFVIIKEDNSDEQFAGEAYADLLLTEQGQELLEQIGFISID